LKSELSEMHRCMLLSITHPREQPRPRPRHVTLSNLRSPKSRQLGCIVLTKPRSGLHTHTHSLSNPMRFPLYGINHEAGQHLSDKGGTHPHRMIHILFCGDPLPLQPVSESSLRRPNFSSREAFSTVIKRCLCSATSPRQTSPRPFSSRFNCK